MYMVPYPQRVDYYTILDNFYIPTNNAFVLQKIDASFMYLTQLRESARIMSDSRAYNALVFLNALDVEYYLTQLTTNYNQIPVIFANICVYYQEKLKIIFKNSSCTNEQKQEFELFSIILNILYSISDRSRAFSNKFLLHKGAIWLANYLDNENLIKKLIIFKRKGLNKTGLDIISLILGILVNISTLCENAKVEFNVNKLSSILTKLLKNIKTHEVQRVLAIMIIANIAKDDEIKELSLTKTVIQDIAKISKLAAKQISENTHASRKRTCIINDDDVEIIDEVCFIGFNGWSWNITKLFTTLMHLAINDDLKYDVYETFNMKEYLEKIIFYGNETEKLYATKLLWQLCFNGNVAKKVAISDILFQPLTNITKQLNFKNEALKKYCEGLLWSLQPKRKRSSEILTSKDHIMISYNSKNRDLCSRIKTELEQNGHAVWIDFEKISGSSLDSMANAIEGCKCMLMCVTERYKESLNCRAEAEYAFRLNKPIIPLVMENGYNPDGWLGIVIGSKIYVNFSKYPFEESMKQLLQQINLLVESNDTQKGSISKNTAPKLVEHGTLHKNNAALKTISISEISNRTPTPIPAHNMVQNTYREPPLQFKTAQTLNIREEKREKSPSLQRQYTVQNITNNIPDKATQSRRTNSISTMQDIKINQAINKIEVIYEPLVLKVDQLTVKRNNTTSNLNSTTSNNSVNVSKNVFIDFKKIEPIQNNAIKTQPSTGSDFSKLLNMDIKI